MNSLIAAGADVNASLPTGETALIFAARVGDIAIATALLDAGANVDAAGTAATPISGTALHWAGYYADQEMARLLLSRGADINARNAEGMTPLMTALYYGRGGRGGSVALLLMEHGADVGVSDCFGGTALSYVANLVDEPTSVLLADKIIAGGARIDTRMVGGRTPLIAAIARGREQLVRLLLNRGADPTARTDDGRSAAELVMASVPPEWVDEKRRDRIAELLRQAGVQG
ncbi:MAG: ankyrin repeat domain-containing protein [Armatimonadetes bacterium]|nr:ankyrin repeat domain-containing protein [Armatimonadota bacterium]